MGATFWSIFVFCLLFVIGEIAAFSAWGLSREHEDDYWRWIISLAGGAIFVTIFWIGYWLGGNEAWWIGIAAVPAIYIWLYLVFSTRSKKMLDRVVFSFFGCMVIFVIFVGGYNAGLRGWWGMAWPFYLAAVIVPYSVLKPD